MKDKERILELEIRVDKLEQRIQKMDSETTMFISHENFNKPVVLKTIISGILAHLNLKLVWQPESIRLKSKTKED